MNNKTIKFQEYPSFLQSKEWLDFERQNGHQVSQIGSSYFIQKHLFGRKHYLYGPRINGDDITTMKLSDPAAVFVRFEPNSSSWTGPGRRTIDVQPKETIVLDLSLSEEEILAGMHQKTRYNIRLAEKKGVRIVIDNGRIEDFLHLMEETTNRDNFSAHSDDHYRAMARFNPDFIQLILAEYEGRVIAAGLFCFSDSVATYLHGASANEFRQVMAPYLLQWTAIKKAKSAGLKYYDFYGISAVKWPGVTRFKQGFGGQAVEYAGTFDLPLSPIWYLVYRVLRFVNRLIVKKI